MSKYKSEYLDIDIYPEFSVQTAKTSSGRMVDIWEDGDIVIQTDDFDIVMSVEELEDIVRVYKLYKTKREVYLAKENK